MFSLFVGIALLASTSTFGRAPTRDAAGPARIIVTLLFATAASIGAGMQFRIRKRIIRQFSYDGRELRFRTLGTSGEQIWRLADIIAVQESRGHAPGIGYPVSLYDGRDVILDYSVQNSAVVAQRM